MNSDTLDVADAVREFVGHSVNCGSGCRCVDHNFNIGGAVRSRHLPRHVEDNKFESDAMDLHLTDDKETASVVDFLRTNYPNVTFFHLQLGHTYRYPLHTTRRIIMIDQLEQFFTNFPSWLVAATTIVTTLSAVTALTPTRSDDKVINSILTVLNILSLNVGANRNADAE